MEQALAAARRDLPAVPEEVFRLWLDDRIRANGWPPDGAGWDRIFFGRSSGFLKELKWVKQLVVLTPEDFGPQSLERAIEVLEANVAGRNNSVAKEVPDTRARFDSAFEFIETHAALPEPLVLLSTFEGYEVCEGNHRVAAMLASAARRGLPGFFPSRVEAWIGAIRA